LKKKLLTLVVICWIMVNTTAEEVYADLYTGLGFSGVTLGRNIPALHLAVFSDSLRFSIISTGVKTKVYYHNAYQASLLSTWRPGKLFWGEVEAGFGGGLLYGVRGYRDDPDDDFDKQGNAVWGPTMYMGWEVLPNVIISLEVIYGIFDSSVLALITQENCAGSIGVRF
jgi:hypothetical protein